MIKRRVIIGLLGIAVVFAAAFGLILGMTTEASGPVTVTIFAAEDSLVRRGGPNTNEGANNFPRVRDAGGTTRSMVGFDLSGVPIAGLKRATLVLTIDDSFSRSPARWGSEGRRVDVHLLNRNWVEGNGKSLGVPSLEATRGTGRGVTWNCPIDTRIRNRVPDCNFDWKGGRQSAVT